MRKLIFAFIFGLLVNNIFAQDSKHTIGLSASFISGVGLSYKYKVNEDWAIKSNSLIVLNTQGCCDSGKYSFFDIGSELQFNFHRTNWTRIYFLAGGSYWFVRNEYEDKIYPKNPQEEPFTQIEKNSYNSFTIGSSLGIELILLKHISFNIDFGYHYLLHLNKFDDNEFGIGLGIGIGYTFGK